jgi:hypothetical protein
MHLAAENSRPVDPQVRIDQEKGNRKYLFG